MAIPRLSTIASQKALEFHSPFIFATPVHLQTLLKPCISIQCTNQLSVAFSHLLVIFRSSQTLRDFSVRESEVYQILLSLGLHTSKATGCDGISALLLKKCAIPHLQPLHHLFCLSLMQRYLPEDWRTHLIEPILKSGSNSLVENYRPISILKRRSIPFPIANSCKNCGFLA